MSKQRQEFMGVVVHPKERDNNIIEVWPIEVVHLVDGKITGSENINVSGLVGTEHTKLNTVKYKTIRASWRPLSDTNRVTSPDVQAGETVWVYTYKNTGTYYWHTQGHDNKVRKKETAMYLFGNTSDIGEPLDLENSHWLMVSAHDQYIQLHTSDNDGEATAYDIVLNMRDGFLSIKDSLENEILLNSADGVLKATIKEKVIVETRDIEVTNETTVINTKGSITVNADTASVTVNKTLDLKGTTLNADFTNVNITANTTVNGTFTVNGNMVSNGTMTSTGDFTTSGDGTFSSVFAPQITANFCGCPNLKSK